MSSSHPDRVPVAATMLVAVCAGVLAAVATHDVALSTGAVTDTRLAWLLPVIIEGGAVVSALLAARRVARGEPSWPERSGLLVLVLLAVWVNASHVATGSVLGVVLAAAPPLVLGASVELLLRRERAEQSVEVAVAPVSERPAQVSIERPVSAAPERDAIEQVSTERERTVTDRQRVTVTRASTRGGSAERVAALLDQEPALTSSEVAERLGIGASTARRWAKTWRDEQQAAA